MTNPCTCSSMMRRRLLQGVIAGIAALSAPQLATAQSDNANEMNVRVRVPENWKQGTKGEVLTMISHPMTTGLATDAEGTIPPQRIIKTFNATLGDRQVIKATYHRSLSLNPYLRFDVTPTRGGDMRFEWTEDTGRVAVHTETVHGA